MYVVDENNDVFVVLVGGTYREIEEASPSTATRPATGEEIAGFLRRRAEAWIVVRGSLALARSVLRSAGLWDEHDLSDVGVPALARAWRGYDPGRGPWEPFARKVVKHAAVAARGRRARPKPEPIARGERSDIDVGYILENLSEEDGLVLLMRYWGNMSLPEIADALGFSKSGAWLRVKRALERAREVHDAQQ